jgi:hypothetical protein
MPHTHRHIVAFPLFALAIMGVLFLGQGMTVAGSLDPTGYERVDATKEDRLVTLPSSDTRVLVFKGAFFELWNTRPVLRDGSVLAGSQGLSEIYADRAVVKGINGAFHMTMKNGTLTVAAITTPVSIRVGQQSIAVPAGYLWSSPAGDVAGRSEGWEKWLNDRKATPAPRKFIREMAEKWGKLPESDGTLKPGDSGQFWSFPLQFAAAKERAMERWSENILSTLGALSRAGDTAQFNALLGRSDVQQAIAGQPDSSALGASLIGDTSVPAIRAEAMPLLHDDNDAFTAAALHPALRSASWTQAPAVNAQVDSDVLRLTNLPLTDTGEEPIPDILLAQWEQEFRSAMDQLGDGKAEFLAAYLPVVHAVSSKFAEKGYPERAQHYRDFILSLGATYRDQLLPETQMFLDAVAHADIADVALPAPMASASTMATPKKAETIPPEVAEKLRVSAREKMTRAGAVFSLQTAFTPISPTTVRVTDIVFATPTMDRTLTFLWDMSKDEIHDITTGGKTLPFPLTFDQFGKWARGEE